MPLQTFLTPQLGTTPGFHWASGSASAYAGPSCPQRKFAAAVVLPDDSPRDRRFIELHVVRSIELPVVAALMRMPLGAARTCWSRLRLRTVARLLNALRTELAARDWQLLAAAIGGRMTTIEAAASVGLAIEEAVARLECVFAGPVRAVLGSDGSVWLRRCALAGA